MFTFRVPNGKVFAGFGTVLGAVSLVTLFWWIKRRNSKNCTSPRMISREQISVMISEMERPGVHIKDRRRVEEIITNMVQAGAEHLQVITDFDRTLSRFSKDGNRVDTCHQALDDSQLVPDWYREQAWAIRDKYYPIEMDSKLTTEEKIPYMVEWWTKAHTLLVQCGVTKAMISQIVADSNITLRSGCDWTFQHLHRLDVPLLIFSAGVGDVIEQVILQRHELFDNTKVVSNYMDFNGQGALVGFQGELIHTFNKNKSAIHKSDYFQHISNRSNIILLGDTLGDLRMADGAKNVNNLLRIGFLNDKIEERLPEFAEAYDIVLVSDETMDIPNAILQKIS